MSPWSGRISAPRPVSSFARLSSPDVAVAMSTAATCAFLPCAWASRASRTHVARPMPLAAPVTSTRM